MFLGSTSQSITAILADAPATVDPTFVAAFHAGGSGQGASNGILADTATTLVAAPSSGLALSVDFINIYNADTASIVVTVNLVDGANTRPMGAWTLLTGETLTYVNGRGWSVINASGQAKSAVPTASFSDGDNLALGSTTGTKIGTGATQKLGFWNATPIVQPVGAAQAAVTPSTDFTGSDTVDKATVLAAVQAVETLANAIRTALVNAGIIKGAA